MEIYKQKRRQHFMNLLNSIEVQEKEETEARDGGEE